MRKTILAIATVVTLTIGNTFAQGYRNREIPARSDNSYEELNINRLDNIVKLSRKQENAIKKIENRYDRLSAGNKRYHTYQATVRLEQEKQREILSVLTPAQRQRLYAFQNQGRRYNWKG